MGVFIRIVVLFLGTAVGAIISAPIVQVAIDFFSLQSQLAKTAPQDIEQILTYYNVIIILLLTLIPVILVFTYFYIKGASEEHATEAAQKASRERIETLRHELISNQSQIAWSMSEYIYPVVQRQTEQYLQEREGAADQQSGLPINRSEVAASTISGWLQSIEEKDEIDRQLRERLEQIMDNNPPDLKGD